MCCLWGVHGPGKNKLFVIIKKKGINQACLSGLVLLSLSSAGIHYLILSLMCLTIKSRPYSFAFLHFKRSSCEWQLGINGRSLTILFCFIIGRDETKLPHGWSAGDTAHRRHSGPIATSRDLSRQKNPVANDSTMSKEAMVRIFIYAVNLIKYIFAPL